MLGILFGILLVVMLRGVGRFVVVEEIDLMFFFVLKWLMIVLLFILVNVIFFLVIINVFGFELLIIILLFI